MSKRRKHNLLSLLLAVFLCPSSYAADSVEYDYLSHYGTTHSMAKDGSVIVGHNDHTEPTVWDSLDNAYILDYSSLNSGEATDIANTGRIIGTQSGEGSPGAYYWETRSSPAQRLLNETNYPNLSTANDISNNGHYVTGQYDTSSWGSWHAYIFDFLSPASSAMTLLPDSGDESNAYAVDETGNLVAGYDWVSGQVPVLWHNDGSGFTKYELSTTSNGNAKAMNPSGSVIVGVLDEYPVRWDRVTTTSYTETLLSSTKKAEANDVSDDGSVIVGTTNVGETQNGFVYETGRGFLTVANWLRSYGFTVDAAADNTRTATGVSADGSIVTGETKNGQPYFARVIGRTPSPTPEPPVGGLITIPDLVNSLRGNVDAPRALAFNGDIVIHGAHGRPIMQLAPVHKSLIWVKGDLGYFSQRTEKAYTHIAEIGGGHRVNDKLQLNLSLGKIYSGQPLRLDGRLKQDITYILPEIITRLGQKPLWATMSVKYGRGTLNARRGYINAGRSDASEGDLTGTIYGMRLRLEWRNALRTGSLGITPYIDQQRLWAVLDAYTERGGGFPARWNRRVERDDLTRLGIDMVKEINKTLFLHATAEHTYWAQGKTAPASGEVFGLMPFYLEGEKRATHWSRLAFGASKELGSHELSAVLNASTSGLTPQYWLALNYKFVF